jgi:hypothetical protein
MRGKKVRSKKITFWLIFSFSPSVTSSSSVTHSLRFASLRFVWSHLLVSHVFNTRGDLSSSKSLLKLAGMDKMKASDLVLNHPDVRISPGNRYASKVVKYGSWSFDLNKEKLSWEQTTIMLVLLVILMILFWFTFG